jgi:ketosteroid isomerase-like protein
MITEEIQLLLANLAANARSGNVDGIMLCFHPRVWAFEFGQTLKTIGIDGVRENCEIGYASVSGLVYEFEVERIYAVDGMAYSYGQEHISGRRNGQPFEVFVCATYIFEKFDDRWLIVHQHLTAAN